MEKRFSWLPSVEEVLQSPEFMVLAHLPRPTLINSARDILQKWRTQIQQKENLPQTKMELVQLIYKEGAELAQWQSRPRLHPVVNATGVVLHTNLGRAPMSENAQKAVCDITEGYCNLEMDMETGSRSYRHKNVEELLCALTGAEACLGVNNNAAALLLALETMAKGREAIISRGQLVEIGGSFRVPEVMEKSGVALCEVGTTNKTRLQDYKEKINEITGILLMVHPSNFHMVGFVEKVGLKELVGLGKTYNIPVLYDWGCGALYPLANLGIGSEESLPQIMATGVDVVTFSGDKLLGGPQCGILAGKKQYIEKISHNPLTRALRVDKMVLAALEATLRSYIDPVTALTEIPTLRLLNKTEAELKELANKLAEKLKELHPEYSIEIMPKFGQVGGGSLPEVELPTWVVGVKIPGFSTEALAAALRKGEPSILGYINNDHLCLDSRTFLEGDIDKILTAFGHLN